ncbi:MAG: hypothetical protein KDD25_08465 [Bdellovibrionales bacterium]|nr:hypothetical protein [Bdellovibrionales bacterium]
MTTTRKSITFMLRLALGPFFIIVFGSLSVASPKETAVDEVLVSRFTVNNRSQKSIYENAAPAFHSFLTQTLKRKSYLDTTPITTIVNPKGSRDYFKKVARKKSGDAILTGSFENKSLSVVLKSGSTGRTLARWTFPLPKKADKGDLQKLAQDVVQTIVTTFPYRGFVIGRKSNLVKINLGRKQAIKPGTTLDVFEFEGANANFTSPKKKLATIEIQHIGESVAAGKIEGPKTVPLYSKIAFDREAAPAEYDVTNRYHNKFFIGLGPSFVFVDTYASQRSDDIDQRLYQLTLSPFWNFAAGYNRFALKVMGGSAENESNSVSFFFGEGTFEVLSWSFGNIGVILSPGLYYSSFKSETTENADLPLTSQTSYSPLVEGHLNWDLSTRARLFINGALYFPVSSSDELNGSSTGNGSRVALGIRMGFGDHIFIEQSVLSEFIQYTFESNTTIDESHSSFDTRLFYFF